MCCRRAPTDAEMRSESPLDALLLILVTSLLRVLFWSVWLSLATRNYLTTSPSLSLRFALQESGQLLPLRKGFAAGRGATAGPSSRYGQLRLK